MSYYSGLVYNLKTALFDSCRPANKLFCICGNDMTGKSTLAWKLAGHYETSLLNSPGMYLPIEKEIRGIIKSDIEMHPNTRYLLHVAADVELFNNVIDFAEPTILDRWWMSRIVYQHLIHEVSISRCISDLRFSSNTYFPKNTLILTCSPDVARERRAKRNEPIDYFDRIVEEQCHHYVNLTKELLSHEYAKINIFHIDTDNLTEEEVFKKALEIYNQQQKGE